MKPSRRERDIFFPNIVELFAGLCAQRVIIGRGRDNIGHVDMKYARGLAEAVCKTPDDAALWRAAAEQRAEELVAVHWSAIVRLAQATLRSPNRQLNGDLIKRIFAGETISPATERRRQMEMMAARAAEFATVYGTLQPRRV
jgi:hypothetical protein